MRRSETQRGEWEFERWWGAEKKIKEHSKATVGWQEEAGKEMEIFFQKKKKKEGEVKI